jgi:hypothetical protein
MRRIVCSIGALAGTLLVAACGGGDNGPKPVASRQTAHGITVTLPAGWQRAPRSLTPQLTDPREVVAVGTYKLRYRPTDCAQIAGSALEDLGATDAFVTVQERGRGSSRSGFPARPKHFGPDLGGAADASECVPGIQVVDRWLNFADGGRHFYVLVAFGAKASAATRKQAWAMLDGLRVDPNARPDWSSAP